MAIILVVDDEQDIRDLLGIYLKNEGYQVEKAASGEEALQLVQKKHIDLLWFRQKIRTWIRYWVLPPAQMIMYQSRLIR